MEVRHCPKCGSDDIGKSTSSFEYGGSTTWSCGDCGWRYKKGRGIGTGTGNAGTHPRELTGGDQTTLTETGDYCSNCETVIKGGHSCTALEVVADADGPLTQEAVVDALDEFHYDGEDELREAIGNRKIALTPTFYRVIEWPKEEKEAPYRDKPEEVEMMDVIRGELERLRDEGETPVRPGVLKERLAAENRTEGAFIDSCLKWMKRRNEVMWSMDGIELRD